ncbi:MAG: hypothetical protein BWY95_02097 [Bacteroidetes bacterium ADurb.BinA104]|nr:MAG: hypothetical protein BWY95_02097 [Bacteroidetes bacterium ADurb.BinA104]
MSNFDETVIRRLTALEREVERLRVKERPDSGSGVTDHGALTGLADNDHPQYLLTTGKAADSDKLDGKNSTYFAPASSVVTDHGALTGLADDDHSQYLNNTRHDTTTRHALGTVVPHDDHGQLTGLADDDHTQYTKHPATSTDNAIVRWDGTGGRTLQNSSVAIDDNGKLSGDGLDGWIYDTDTWSYVSATSFKIAGKNVAYRFPKGTKIKLVNDGSTKYFYVVAATFSTDTTITITGGSDYSLVSGTISGQAYSYAAAPQNFPQRFNWAPSFTGFSTPPTGAHRFCFIGNLCHVFVFESGGESNSTAFEFTAPVTAIMNVYEPVRLCNNGSIGDNPGMAVISTDGQIKVYLNLSGSKTTASGTKYVQFEAAYLF